MLGALIQGGMGLWGMAQGNKQMSNVANNMPSQEDLEGRLGKSQGLIDRMTNFGQYSGPGMDLASQEGNQAVESSMMMGMGGSQANAIKNRMKRSSLTGVYDKFNQGMGTALNAQMGINKGVSGQMHQDRGDARAIQMGQAGAQMGASSNFMGGADGMAGFGAGLGSLGQTALMGGYDKKKGVGMGGMLGMLGWGK